MPQPRCSTCTGSNLHKLNVSMCKFDPVQVLHSGTAQRLRHLSLTSATTFTATPGKSSSSTSTQRRSGGTQGALAEFVQLQFWDWFSFLNMKKIQKAYERIQKAKRWLKHEHSLGNLGMYFCWSIERLQRTLQRRVLQRWLMRRLLRMCLICLN